MAAAHVPAARRCGVERGAPLAWPLAWPGACVAAVAGVWDTDADGFRREFVAKVIRPGAAGLPRR